MTDDQNQNEPAADPSDQDAKTGTGEPGEQTPPWEREGEDFDPQKAWTLIQHLRDDNAKLKEANEANGAKLREIEDAKLTEREKLERDLKEARERLASVNLAKAWAEARAKHPQLTEQDFDLIGAGTPEQIEEKAAKLAARIDAQAAHDAGQHNINPLMRKPAKPTGGADPTSAAGGDWLREAFANK